MTHSFSSFAIVRWEFPSLCWATAKEPRSQLDTQGYSDRLCGDSSRLVRTALLLCTYCILLRHKTPAYVSLYCTALHHEKQAPSRTVGAFGAENHGVHLPRLYVKLIEFLIRCIFF